MATQIFSIFIYYLGKISMMTFIFFRGWNHQLDTISFFYCKLLGNPGYIFFGKFPIEISGLPRVFAPIFFGAVHWGRKLTPHIFDLWERWKNASWWLVRWTPIEIDGLGKKKAPNGMSLLVSGCFLKWWYPHCTPQNDHFSYRETNELLGENPPFEETTPIYVQYELISG